MFERSQLGKFPSAVILCLGGQDLCFPFFRTRVGVERGANMILAQGSLGGDGDESPQLRSKPGCLNSNGKRTKEEMTSAGMGTAG